MKSGTKKQGWVSWGMSGLNSSFHALDSNQPTLEEKKDSAADVGFIDPVAADEKYAESQHDFYLKLIKLSKEYQKQFQELLEKALDTNIYEKSIQSAFDSETRRYRLHSEDADWLTYYKKILNAFIDTNVFLESVDKVHLDVIPVLGVRSTFGKIKNYTFKMGAVNQNLNDFFTRYNTLYYTIASLNLDKLATVFSKKALKQLINGKEVAKTLLSNPFVGAIMHLAEECSDLVEIESQKKLEEVKMEDSKNDVTTDKEKLQTDLTQQTSNKGGILAALSEELMTLGELVDKLVVELIAPHSTFQSINNYNDTYAAGKSIDAKIKAYAKTKQNWPATAKLVHSVVPDVLKLIKNIYPAYASVSKAMTSHIMQTVQQVNMLLRECFLYADHLEIEACLKEGYWLSLGKPEAKPEEQSLVLAVKNFNDWVETWNYEFLDKEAFPFKPAILKQRQKLLESENVALANIEAQVEGIKREPSLVSREALENRQQLLLAKIENHTRRIELLEGRVASGERDVQKQMNDKAVSREKILSDAYKSQRDKVNALIQARIDELQKEINNAWTPFRFAKTPKGEYWTLRTKQKKINLLNTVKNEISLAGEKDAKTNTIIPTHSLYRSPLFDIEREGALPNSDLLFEGRTGMMMEEVRYISASSQDRSDLIEEKAQFLTDKKDHLWFFKQSRGAKLQARIDALKELQRLMMQSGYTSADALEIMCVDSPQEYNLLYTKEGALVREIAKLEEHIPVATLGKKPIEKIKRYSREFIEARNNTITAYEKTLQDQKVRVRTEFFADSKVGAIVAREEALKVFKTWIGKPRFNVDAALRAIHWGQPEIYKILQQETALFEELRSTEKVHGVRKSMGGSLSQPQKLIPGGA